MGPKKGTPRKRKYEQHGIIPKFDAFIESRISIVANWFWKSGLMIFIAGTMVYYLHRQDDNIIETRINSTNIIALSEILEKIASDAENTKAGMVLIRQKADKNEVDIEYLRKDFDDLKITIKGT